MKIIKIVVKDIITVGLPTQSLHLYLLLVVVGLLLLVVAVAELLFVEMLLAVTVAVMAVAELCFHLHWVLYMMAGNLGWLLSFPAGGRPGFRQRCILECHG
jgi:hypothetical protein